MPGETANIGEFARIVSEKVFSKFGWKISGTENENFPCEKIEVHQRKSRSPTHPCDIVFYYDDPYEEKRQYFLTDLKSYGRDSITKTSLRAALRELGRSVDCANSSAEWRKKYVNQDVGDWQVHGLLFIFNHDNNFKHSFETFFLDESPDDIALPKNSRLFVFGPERIHYLQNILADISKCRGDQRLPLEKSVFLYPHRIRRFSKEMNSETARIELLLGPWQILPFDFEDTEGKHKTGVFIYYQGSGKDPAEFEYIFDFCFRNQLVKDGHTIEIRMLNPDSSVLQVLSQAKENFEKNFYSSPDIAKRMMQFNVYSIDETEIRFSSEIVGMEARNG